MKKYFAIAMIALAAVCTSACNTENSNSDFNYSGPLVNGWLTEESSPSIEALSDVVSSTSATVQLPDSVYTALETALSDILFTRVINLASDGTGQIGVLVDKDELNHFADAVKETLTNAEELEPNDIEPILTGIAAFRLAILSMNNNDILGTAFTYTVTPDDDDASGTITATITIDGKQAQKSVRYAYLKENSVTIGYQEVEQGKTEYYTYPMVSAASREIKLGKLVDLTALMSSATAPSTDELVR